MVSLMRALAVAGALAAFLPGGAAVFGPQPAFAEELTRGVPFFTVRARTGETDPAKFYGDERGSFEAGFCDLEARQLDFLSFAAEAVPFYIPEEVLLVKDVRPAPMEEVIASVTDPDSARGPVLYTHGFYIDFEKGCRRATILKELAGLGERFLWFSWPSDGGILNYTQDEADLQWSVFDIADSIIALAEHFEPGEVHVAGHSLGARGTVLALYDLSAKRPDLQLGHVVLLAPDIDFGLFTRLLPRIRPMVRDITVYVADTDRPLALSERVHGYARLGQSGNDVSLLGDVEVIDVSDLQVRSPTGHLYHIHNPEVGADIDRLINEGEMAAERPGLEQEGPNLWRLLPP